MTQELGVGQLKRLEELTLHEVESVRLILRGDSVVDWHRLNLQTADQARALLLAHEFDPEDHAHRARLESIKNEAIGYLRRQFDFPIPSPVAASSVEELLLLASGKGHRQLCACAILKAMHIIHHLDGRELLFSLPMSDHDVFHLVEEKIYRVIGGMLSAGFPIVEFVGGRKNKDSLYTKLLSKRDSSASQIYDKLRFRIVTRSADDILPVLVYLTERLFPFSQVLSGESINTIFHFRTYCQRHPHLRLMIPDFQTGIDDAYTPSDNAFSGQSYRVIHFVVDLPVRLPPAIMEIAPPTAWSLGPIIFVLCEFQILDRETEASNELGDASHERYKDRQKFAVKRRLKIGVRPLREPPPSSQPMTRPPDAALRSSKPPPQPTRPPSRPASSRSAKPPEPERGKRERPPGKSKRPKG
ncbi:MAG: TIGR04552 family protein [Polyangiaceae bacterium]